MPRTCFVPNCRTGYLNVSLSEGRVNPSFALFSFPWEENRRQAWIRSPGTIEFVRIVTQLWMIVNTRQVRKGAQHREPLEASIFIDSEHISFLRSIRSWLIDWASARGAVSLSKETVSSHPHTVRNAASFGRSFARSRWRLRSAGQIHIRSSGRTVSIFIAIASI